MAAKKKAGKKKSVSKRAKAKQSSTKLIKANSRQALDKRAEEQMQARTAGPYNEALAAGYQHGDERGKPLKWAMDRTLENENRKLTDKEHRQLAQELIPASCHGAINEQLKKQYGRPDVLKYQPVIVGQIFYNLIGGMSRKRACMAAGVAEKTFYRWLKEHTDLASAVSHAEAYGEQSLVDVIKTQIHGKQDGKLALDFLSRRFPREWSEKQIHGHVQMGEGEAGLLDTLMHARAEVEEHDKQSTAGHAQLPAATTDTAQHATSSATEETITEAEILEEGGSPHEGGGIPAEGACITRTVQENSKACHGLQGEPDSQDRDSPPRRGERDMPSHGGPSWTDVPQTAQTAQTSSETSSAKPKDAAEGPGKVPPSASERVLTAQEGDDSREGTKSLRDGNVHPSHQPRATGWIVLCERCEAIGPALASPCPRKGPEPGFEAKKFNPFEGKDGE